MHGLHNANMKSDRGVNCRINIMFFAFLSYKEFDILGRNHFSLDRSEFGCIINIQNRLNLAVQAIFLL